MTYNYEESIKEDIRDYISQNYTDFQLAVKLQNKSYFTHTLTDRLWSEDSVTGNGSGSYTFNRYVAKQYVQSNLELCVEALSGFSELEKLGDKIANEEYEYLDVTIRCYLLSRCVREVIEEL